jgi:hypothetical protein
VPERVETMKRCVKCGQWKNKEEFAWRNKFLGTLQKACRTCRAIENKEWYERHQPEQRKRVRDRKIKNREVAQRFIYEYLSFQKCVDCGEYDFSVLRGKKKKEISRMIADGDSIDAILQEIAKCQVVGVNCHALKLTIWYLLYTFG